MAAARTRPLKTPMMSASASHDRHPRRASLRRRVRTAVTAVEPRVGTGMRIATWNVNSLKARLPRVEEWLDYAKPDVLCMQETKLADAAFPHMAFEALGYQVAHHGNGRWNGVAIASRVGIEDAVAGFSGEVEDDIVESRLISATCAGVRV